MSTVIICIVLALIIIFAIVNSAKHFRGVKVMGDEEEMCAFEAPTLR